MQKFNIDDEVIVTKTRTFYYGTLKNPLDLDNKAVIVGSFADLFGGCDTKNYRIRFIESGKTWAWVDETEMILLK